VASSKDRQRAIERARYERVRAKIDKKKKEQKRRKRVAIISGITVLAVAGIAVGSIFIATSGSPSKSDDASASSSASATASAAPQPTAHVAGCTTPVSTAPKKLTWKTEPAMTIDQTAKYTMTIKTNCGDIVISMDASKTPHTVNSFDFLAQQGYFSDTYCHRLTTSGIYVLQCGDPTATATSGGSGGPGYTIPDENLTALGTAASGGTVTYPAGEVAMANTGQANSGGSQFFLVYQDSPLAPTYTPFGTITSGLDILQAIAKAGSNNSNGSGDGNPMQKVQIQSVTVTKD
jgi:peptidyl-prolyl cis-trans isomerase B (cyclophilin B)